MSLVSVCNASDPRQLWTFSGEDRGEAGTLRPAANMSECAAGTGGQCVVGGAGGGHGVFGSGGVSVESGLGVVVGVTEGQHIFIRAFVWLGPPF